MAKNRKYKRLALNEFKNSMARIKAVIDVYKDTIWYLRRKNNIKTVVIVILLILLVCSFIFRRTYIF